jgi:hypothetical protein
MSNEYFQPGSVPAPNSPGSSAVMRTEFASIASGFDKLPVLAGHADEVVAVNSSGTGLVSTGATFSDFVTLNGVQTIINKTIAWADNTFPGFGTAATKNANTTPGTGEVPVMVGPNLFGAIDGSQLINLNINNISGIIPVAKGGTGASDVTGAQANLGINLKANINSPSFTGTPTAPTPGFGDSSARIATTFFVTNVLNTVGAVTPGDDLPLMDGSASAGTSGSFIVSRVDHVHPSDTSRAPASAATAAGTTLTPVGGIAATNVQAGIAELDTEKAPLASPAFTGTPTAPTPALQDTSTRIATTAWVQTELAAIPPAGMYPSSDIPLMNGVGNAGTAAEASRGDHVHPTDTTRAPLASPAFTGNPTAPTPSVGDNDTSIATTAFVTAADLVLTGDINTKDALNVKKTSNTGSAILPAGTQAQRDGSPAIGAIRFSSTLVGWEGWNGTNWVPIGGGQMFGAALVKGIFYNNTNIAENVTVVSGTNGGSFGPITVDNGFAVTVENGAVWSIV